MLEERRLHRRSKPVRFLKQAAAEQQHSTEKRLERFNETYGEWLACDINTEIVNDRLSDLDLAPQTVRHYRASLHHLFELGIEQGGARENPVAKAVNPKVKKGEVGILWKQLHSSANMQHHGIEDAQHQYQKIPLPEAITDSEQLYERLQTDATRMERDFTQFLKLDEIDAFA